MSASVFGDSMVMNSGPDGPVSKISGQNEVDFVKCDCCGLTEECTPSYINTVREMQVWREMDMRALCRGCERRSFPLPKADKPGRSHGPAFELLQQVSGRGPAAGSDGALDSGHEAGVEEELGGPEIDAEQPDDDQTRRVDSVGELYSEFNPGRDVGVLWDG
ncbi:hypothetical protein C2S53_019663 [Perilla frutescens var. hirtella]|uniref:Uncharacterized protein n=1 Tax=Perilla frutescens var. hirtella TaxID=608512 RepID=A0AAD4IU04_PERFH|nr:hypothetical protein C2S53_019663 [Perilla frutescens var. hirtella]